MKKTNNKGFSLVELIIVIAIMAVLIGVLAPQFIKYVERSRESTDLQNIAETKTAVESYVADNQIEGEKAITVKVTPGSGSTPGTIVVAGDGYTANDLKEYGIADSQNLKSNSWATFTWTYNDTGSAYQWKCTGTKGDGSDVGATYFYADGSKVGTSGGSGE